MAEDTPYRPPVSDVTARPCPTCGKAMQSGCLYSLGSIRWFGDSDSGLKKFLGGDRLTSKVSVSGRIAGHRCVGCRVILVHDVAS